MSDKLTLNKQDLQPSTATRPFVVYWNNIPSPYMVERFNAVADRDTFDFEAWFNDRLEPDRSWDVDEASWRFSYRYIPTTHLFNRAQHWPIPILGRRPDVLVSLYAEPAFLVGWTIGKLRGSKTAFWCQVTMDRWVRRKRWKNAIKRAVFPHVDITLGSGEESRAFAMRFGVSPDRALRLPHSIDVRHYAEGALNSRPRRELSRQEIGLEGTTFIYVGRFWWGKGINYLLEAFEIVQRNSTKPVSLLLVGDGQEEIKLRRTCTERGIRNVFFTGFLQKPDLPHYYALADVFVFPTLGDPYGLVVDEAMACGLPVIGRRRNSRPSRGRCQWIYSFARGQCCARGAHAASRRRCNSTRVYGSSLCRKNSRLYPRKMG